MRTIIDITDPQLRDLDALSKRAGQSRAALIRQSIDEFLARRRVEPTDGFGLWRGEAEDGLAYQERVRAEW